MPTLKVKYLHSLKAHYLKILVYSLALGFFIFTVYRVSGYSLVLDDWHLLADRQFSSVLASFTGPWIDFVGGFYYRPVTSLAFYLSNLLIGNHVYWHYYLNILMLLIIGFLLYCILNLFARNRLLTSIIAVVFLVSPYAAYTYSWISERTDLIYIVFYALSYYLFLSFFLRERKSTVIIILSLACFSLSLLSKELAMSLPFVILLTVLIYSNKNKLINFKVDKKQVLCILPYFVLLTAYIFIRTLFVGNVFGGESVYYGAPIIVQIAAVCFQYLKAVIFGFIPITMFFSIGASVGWLLLITVNVYLFSRLKGQINWEQKKNIIFLLLFVLIISVFLLKSPSLRLFLMNSIPVSILMGYNIYNLIVKHGTTPSSLAWPVLIALIVPLMFYSFSVQNIFHPGSRTVIQHNISVYHNSPDEIRERIKTVYFDKYPQYVMQIDSDQVILYDTKYDYGYIENLAIDHYIIDYLRDRGLLK